jgi:hypothetical protein
MKPSFNYSRRKLPRSAAQRAARQNSRAKGRDSDGQHRIGRTSVGYGQHQARIPCAPRIPSLLASIRDLGVRSLPSRAALHARSGTGLPCQANATGAPPNQLTPRFLRARALPSSEKVIGALAPLGNARDHRARDGELAVTFSS